MFLTIVIEYQFMFISNSKLFMKLGSYALSRAPIVSQVIPFINNNEDICKKAIESKGTVYKSLGFISHNYKSFSYAAGSALAVNIAQSCAKIALKQTVNSIPLSIKKRINDIFESDIDLSDVYSTPISKLTGNKVINAVGKFAIKELTDRTADIVKNYTPTSPIIAKGLDYIDSNKCEIKNFLVEACNSVEESISKDSINELFSTVDKSLNAGMQAVIESSEEKFIFDTKSYDEYEAITVGNLDQIEDYN